jgi:hypothetical protein
MSLTNTPVKETNLLFPIFLKLEKFNVLIVGGGNVALEKLTAIIQNTENVSVKVVAEKFNDEVLALTSAYGSITTIEKRYEVSDLEGIQILIVAVNDVETSQLIYNNAHAKGIIVNVADKPDLCDFYLGSIVRKGNLKIAISTNGKSPTLAKRLREVFTELIPDEIDEVLANLRTIRNSLKGDFAVKVSKLNSLTKILTGEDKLN